MSRQTKDDNIIWYMHFACCITKTTEAHRIYNTSCFSTATMVTWVCLNITFICTLPVLLTLVLNGGWVASFTTRSLYSWGKKLCTLAKIIFMNIQGVSSRTCHISGESSRSEITSIIPKIPTSDNEQRRSYGRKQKVVFLRLHIPYLISVMCNLYAVQVPSWANTETKSCSGGYAM